MIRDKHARVVKMQARRSGVQGLIIKVFSMKKIISVPMKSHVRAQLKSLFTRFSLYSERHFSTIK